MSRLTKLLSGSARGPEAKEWMEKAIALAPSIVELRKEFITQLVNDKRLPDALEQYKQLATIEPNNPDYLREWGKLVFKDRLQEIETRNREATRIWNQLIAARPSDASNLAQVGDLFRMANLNEKAIELYRRAISTSPNDPQYREYLGEFLCLQKRTDEAMDIWKSIAEGTRRTAENVVRLAAVYRSFGLHDLAVTEISEACRLDSKDFRLQLRGADYQQRAGRFDDAIQFVAAAEKLAANEDEQDTGLRQRIETLTTSQRLVAEKQRLASAIPKNASTSAAEWHLLARYCEADRQWSAVSQAILSVLKIDPNSISILLEWSILAIEHGEQKEAEFQLTRLLKIVTECPKRKTLSDPSKTKEIAIPPMTETQFSLSIKISDFANGHNMPSLSRMAVQEAMCRSSLSRRL